MFKLSRGLRLTVAVFTVYWGSCSPGTPRENSSPDSPAAVFRFRIPADPPSLDPIHSADFVSQTVVNNIFDPLLRLDAHTGEVAPAIAERWAVENGGLAFRFFLRRNLRFHNGRVLTAGDVRYSFERILDPRRASERPWILLNLLGAREFRTGATGEVQGIRIEGDSVVVLELEKPYAPFLVQLAMVGASIVPREEVERLGDELFGQEPVGSGAFRFVSWKHDSRIVLERFPEYCCPSAPKIEKVEFTVVPNISVAFEKYRAGELDLLDQLPPGHVGLARKRMAGDLHIWPGLSVRYLGFNLTRIPFKGNRKLRQAFNYAINKQAVTEVLGEGVDVVSAGAVPPGVGGRNASLAGYPFDLKRARKLLAESGYPGGQGLDEITLLYNNDPLDKRICEFVQACLSEIGVRIRLKSLEWAAFLAAVRAGESELFRGSWVGDFPDAHNFLYTLFYSGNWGDAGNYSRFANPAVDSLLTLAAGLSDYRLRETIYSEVEGIVSYEAPWIFLFHPGQVALLKPGWKGAAFPAVGIWAFPLAGLTK